MLPTVQLLTIVLPDKERGSYSFQNQKTWVEFDAQRDDLLVWEDVIMKLIDRKIAHSAVSYKQVSIHLHAVVHDILIWFVDFPVYRRRVQRPTQETRVV